MGAGTRSLRSTYLIGLRLWLPSCQVDTRARSMPLRINTPFCRITAHSYELQLTRQLGALWQTQTRRAFGLNAGPVPIAPARRNISRVAQNVIRKIARSSEKH